MSDIRGWVKWVLFFSSYSPLFLILLWRQLAGAGTAGALKAFLAPPYLIPGLAVVIVVSNAIAGILLLQARRLEAERIRVESWSSKTGEALSYIVTYIIPFLNFDPAKDLVPLLILLGVIGVVYVNSNLLYTNPVLSLFGIRIFEVTRDSGRKLMVLTWKSEPCQEHNKVLLARKVSGNIYLEK
jgi:hypothetical protein